MNLRDPDAKPFFLLKQYLLICVLFTFALKARYQELCVAFADASGSVLSAGHLYNAVRQENILRRPWRDMEIAMTLQSQEVFFVGVPPSSPGEYDMEFQRATRVSATAFASNRPKNTPIACEKGPKGLEEQGPVWKLFGGRYCSNDRSVSFTADSIKTIIEGMLDDEDDDDEDHDSSTAADPASTKTKQPARKVNQAQPGSLLRRSKRNASTIPTLDFLGDIADALHTEGLKLTFDYLMMHRFCWRVLRAVNEKWQAAVAGCVRQRISGQGVPTSVRRTSSAPPRKLRRSRIDFHLS
ncbi:MAG: hypothetical protein L6R39_003466 [Caloplaca ligustica]|nr:MAG: hypothetical protein L6R39_003466 [Caloplaca ligustica]